MPPKVVKVDPKDAKVDTKDAQAVLSKLQGVLGVAKKSPEQKAWPRCVVVGTGGGMQWLMAKHGSELYAEYEDGMYKMKMFADKEWQLMKHQLCPACGQRLPKAKNASMDAKNAVKKTQTGNAMKAQKGIKKTQTGKSMEAQKGI